MSKGLARGRRKVYLAGPEVFLPDAAVIGKAKIQICQSLGLDAVFPYAEPSDPDDLSPEAGLQIFRRCIDWMGECNVVIANMTPFRGVSMDVGTAVEMGFMYGLGHPIFGYTNEIDDYDTRVCMDMKDNMAVESFHFVDNLMCEGPVRLSGAQVVRSQVPESERFSELSGFKRCVKQAVEVLKSWPDVG